jgi:DNA polymerase
MDVVTIDFETYYDTQYSLSKMTTEAYVRDQRFEVIGVGIKVNDYPTDWYSGDNVGRFLKSMPYHDKAILCHNTAFDGAILSWRFGIKPKLWLDTLSMSRPLHASSVGGALKNLAAYYKLGVKGDEVVNALGKQRQHFMPDELSRYAEYCKNDVELTYKLFRKLSKGFPTSELMVIDQTLRMYTEPTLVIDTTLLSAHLDAVQMRKANLVESLGLTGFTDEEARQLLMSNDKFAAYLEKLNVAAPMKTSLKTGKQAWAFSKTDKEFTALLDHPNEMVSTAVAARLGVKSTIEESRTKALIGVATRGTLPIMLNYYGAHTGRFSGGDKMNLQNLPRGGALRKSLRAPEGMRLVTCDSAQIEARVVAWLAEQNDLTEAFRQKRDIYSEFASEVYNRKVDRKRKEIDPVTGAVTYPDTVEGFVGKTCILGLGYGMGAIKFQRTLEIGQAGVSVKLHMSEADRIVRLYRQKNHKIVSLWNRSGNALNDMVCGNNGQLTASIGYTAEGIVLPNKLMIKYPALQRDADGYSYIGDARAFRKLTVQRLSGQATGDIDWVRIYGGKVVENVTQAVARIVVSEQMARIGQRYKVVLQVHDEVVVICPEDEVSECRAFMEEVMSTPPTWAPDLPVACESGSGVSYGDAK